MNDTPAEFDVLMLGGRVGTTGSLRRYVAEALLLNLVLVWVLLFLLPRHEPASSCPIDLYEALSVCTCWFWIPATLLSLLVWSVAGGAIQRAVILHLAGLPGNAGVPLRHGFRRAPTAFGAPFFVLLSAAFLLGVAWGISRVVLIPYVGWPLLVLLLPVLFVVALAAVRLLLRWVLAGHLAGPAIAEGTADAWRAQSRANAYLRRSPWRTLRARGHGLLVWILGTIATAGPILGAIVILLYFLGPWSLDYEIPRGEIPWAAQIVILLLVGAWVAAIPVGAFFGVRAGVYLVLRRELDGIPVDERGKRLDPEPTLEELGFRLVERLRARSEEE